MLIKNLIFDNIITVILPYTKLRQQKYKGPFHSDFHHQNSKTFFPLLNYSTCMIAAVNYEQMVAISLL